MHSISNSSEHSVNPSLILKGSSLLLVCATIGVVALAVIFQQSMPYAAYAAGTAGAAIILGIIGLALPSIKKDISNRREKKDYITKHFDPILIELEKKEKHITLQMRPTIILAPPSIVSKPVAQKVPLPSREGVVQNSPLYRLPKEILRVVMSYLSLKELTHLREVSLSLKDCIDESLPISQEWLGALPKEADAFTPILILLRTAEESNNLAIRQRIIRLIKKEIKEKNLSLVENSFACIKILQLQPDIHLDEVEETLKEMKSTRGKEKTKTYILRFLSRVYKYEYLKKQNTTETVLKWIDRLLEKEAPSVFHYYFNLEALNLSLQGRGESNLFINRIQKIKEKYNKDFMISLIQKFIQFQAYENVDRAIELIEIIEKKYSQTFYNPRFKIAEIAFENNNLETALKTLKDGSFQKSCWLLSFKSFLLNAEIEYKKAKKLTPESNQYLEKARASIRALKSSFWEIKGLILLASTEKKLGQDPVPSIKSAFKKLLDYKKLVDLKTPGFEQSTLNYLESDILVSIAEIHPSKEMLYRAELVAQKLEFIDKRWRAFERIAKLNRQNKSKFASQFLSSICKDSSEDINKDLLKFLVQHHIFFEQKNDFFITNTLSNNLTSLPMWLQKALYLPSESSRNLWNYIHEVESSAEEESSDI